MELSHFLEKWKQVDIIIRNEPDFPDKPRFSFICGCIFARVSFLDSHILLFLMFPIITII